VELSPTRVHELPPDAPGFRFISLSGLVSVAFFAGAVVPGFTQQYQAPNVSTPASPAVVLDNAGLEVGPLINTGGADSALSKDSGINFAFQVNTKGFVQTGVFFSYYFGRLHRDPTPVIARFKFPIHQLSQNR